MSIDENRIFRLSEQTVVLDDFPAEGWILDVGGGGGAVMGQLKGGAGHSHRYVFTRAGRGSRRTAEDRDGCPGAQVPRLHL